MSDNKPVGYWDFQVDLGDGRATTVITEVSPDEFTYGDWARLVAWRATNHGETVTYHKRSFPDGIEKKVALGRALRVRWAYRHGGCERHERV
jgi:hypothetical protein